MAVNPDYATVFDEVDADMAYLEEFIEAGELADSLAVTNSQTSTSIQPITAGVGWPSANATFSSGQASTFNNLTSNTNIPHTITTATSLTSYAAPVAALIGNGNTLLPGNTLPPVSIVQ